MYETAIVIPSYNQSEYLLDCIESIIKKVKKGSFLIVIVDDASNDAKVDELLEQMQKEQHIHVIRNECNLGFSKSVNRGILFAISTSQTIKYFVVLNQDVRLVNDVVGDAIDFMRDKTKIGICGPRLFNADRTIQNSFYSYPSIIKKLAQLMKLKKLGSWFWSAKHLHSWSCIIPDFARIYLKNMDHLQHPIEVPWLCGACLIIKKELFDSIEGFDDNFRMYAEDMDFCRRAREKGWGTYYLPGCHLIHYGKGKPTRDLREILIVYHDSMEYYYRKHHRGWEQRILLILNRIEQWK
jgi:GT2 family glycosyltransferase